MPMFSKYTNTAIACEGGTHKPIKQPVLVLMLSIDRKHIEEFLCLTKSMETKVLILLKETFLFTGIVLNA